MAAPTALEVSVDDTEYSRYETGRGTITASVVVSGAATAVAEDVLVELTKDRRDRNAVVASQTITVDGPQDLQEFTVTFVLEDIVDSDLISLVRHGKYFVRVTSVTDDTVTAESQSFKVSVVTVQMLKDQFLFGIDLRATELKKPKFQPTIPGVTIEQMSKTHPLGFCQLTYTYSQEDLTDATAIIGAGPDGTVTITADGTGFTGVDGNPLSVEVLVPAGTSALSAVLTSNRITVSLDVTAGVPNAAANTATLVAAAIDALAAVSAVASGTGATSFTVAEGPTQFAGGTSNITRLLSWGGGTAVSITEAPKTYIIKKGTGPGPLAKLGDTSDSDFACIRVRSLALLPKQSVTEEILIDLETLSDDVLCDYVEQAIAYLEEDLLATYIEPCVLVTDRDFTTIQFAAGVQAPAPIFQSADFDRIVSPLTYFRPAHGTNWVNIDTPYPQILRVDNLFGAIANTRVIDIDLSWIEPSRTGGMIQLVPFNQEIAFDFVGLIWTNALRGSVELPNFWHFQMIVGLRDASAELREFVGKWAAIKALVVAGMALRPGVGSLSLSRDGVSQSVSYTNQAEYGIYSATIKAYQDWIEKYSKELKGKYRGPMLAVV
jgi:hypothetical protein